MMHQMRIEEHMRKCYKKGVIIWSDHTVQNLPSVAKHGKLIFIFILILFVPILN